MSSKICTKPLLEELVNVSDVNPFNLPVITAAGVGIMGYDVTTDEDYSKAYENLA